jgi:hypothetical protein
MKILFVGAFDPWTRSVATLNRYVKWCRKLGHQIAVHGAPNPELPDVPTSLETTDADLVLFILQVPHDIPDMPGLARLMDRLPRDKRIVLDLWGRFNDTIRVDHDFNHLEKFDGHPEWEWKQAISALGDTVMQPTLVPRRDDVGQFLFHGFDPDAVAKHYSSPKEAAEAWLAANNRGARPYGVVYVGSNWQRWTQVRAFLEGYAPSAERIGQVCLAGWDWAERPGWAVEMGIAGVDTDAELLADLRAEVRMGLRFDRVVPLLGQGRFAPVIHRPLFRELGLVTNRTFETFEADTVPVLMLPGDFVEAIYGPAALRLVPGDDIAAHLEMLLEDPVATWEAVLETRSHLARHHAIAQRLAELEAIASTKSVISAAVS